MAGQWVSLLPQTWKDEDTNSPATLPYTTSVTDYYIGVYALVPIPTDGVPTKVRGSGTINLTAAGGEVMGGFYLDDSIYEPLSLGVNAITLPETSIDASGSSAYYIYLEVDASGTTATATLDITSLEWFVEPPRGAWVPLADGPFDFSFGGGEQNVLEGSTVTYVADPDAVFPTNTGWRVEFGAAEPTKLRVTITDYLADETYRPAELRTDYDVGGTENTAPATEDGIVNAFVPSPIEFAYDGHSFGYLEYSESLDNSDGRSGDQTYNMSIEVWDPDAVVVADFWTDIVGCSQTTDAGPSTPPVVFYRSGGPWSSVTGYTPTHPENIAITYEPLVLPPQSLTVMNSSGSPTYSQVVVSGGRIVTTSPINFPGSGISQQVMSDALNPGTWAPPAGNSVYNMRVSGTVNITSADSGGIYLWCHDQLAMAPPYTGADTAFTIYPSISLDSIYLDFGVRDYSGLQDVTFEIDYGYEAGYIANGAVDAAALYGVINSVKRADGADADAIEVRCSGYSDENGYVVFYTSSYDLSNLPDAGESAYPLTGTFTPSDGGAPFPVKIEYYSGGA